MSGLIIDLFAGGGGASTGLERALGRPVDIAINHDRMALALHAANHPLTRHLCEDMWQVDPVQVCGGLPVDVLWASPDCKDHSNAKGGRPRSTRVRGLAWMVVRWMRAVRPRLVMLENVPEFRDWGPLLDGRRDPSRKGRIFNIWIERIRQLGYNVEWRLLSACDYGVPTTRKRLFLVARCDGRPIRWPEPTHGPGLAQPWRVAADIIDWSIPCPSIFLSREQARRLGVRRPLAENTLRRIAAGVRKYVLEAANPFIVSYYGPKGEDFRGSGLDEPLRTQTCENRHALVTPYIIKANHAYKYFRGNTVEELLRTVTANEPGFALAAPVLVQTGYGERPGQKPRALNLQEPLGTVVAGGGKHALVAAFLAQHNGGPRNKDLAGRAADAPLSTVTGTGSQQGVVAAHCIRHFGRSIGHEADAPAAAITAGGGGHTGIVTSHLTKFYGTAIGADMRQPLPTVTGGGNHAGGHAAEVRAFLVKYYGTGGQWGGCDEPLHTIVGKARLGLVTVHGETWAIDDIGLRMLTPRELYRAQGFPDDYEISYVADGVRLTKAQQIEKCGNSVCPGLAEVLTGANCDWMDEQDERQGVAG